MGKGQKRGRGVRAAIRNHVGSSGDKIDTPELEFGTASGQHHHHKSPLRRDASGS